MRDEARALMGGGSEEAVDRVAARLLASAQRVEQLEREIDLERQLVKNAERGRQRAIAERDAAERERDAHGTRIESARGHLEAARDRVRVEGLSWAFGAAMDALRELGGDPVIDEERRDA
ncbi:hypothetical protein [Sandaracinus amylolyticus]|uniref:Uncharacterized protein n=1 Tax=Sandaracinus amylolyticus TaxID=927083 RepID=A0A0F6W6M2_9BACT|nr:hypothetical protein [Sandaracinus amylolyticus]AKF08843.1 hypothetical protein DB32_005992 [Sandaracinus amylolyticus]